MTLGIIGGGQLGMFICFAAKKRGIYTVVLDPNENCSSSNFCDYFIQASYNDSNAITQLFSKSDMVTFEFENVDLDVLKTQELDKLMPRINSLYISSDRLIEKTVAKYSDLDVGNFYPISNKEDFDLYKKLFNKAVLKTRKFGYDGRGQQIVFNDTELVESFFSEEFILEEYIEYDFELSAICARNKSGEFIFLNSNINVHCNHILYKSSVTQINLSELCNNFMVKNKLYGILTFEFFVKDGKYYFNELAPRPHNSGHSSIDACNFNQNDLVISSIFDDSFPNVVCKDMTMYNIIGENYNKDFNIPNTNYYDYFKDKTQDNRKMAHITTNDKIAMKTIELLLEEKYE